MTKQWVYLGLPTVCSEIRAPFQVLNRIYTETHMQRDAGPACWRQDLLRKTAGNSIKGHSHRGEIRTGVVVAMVQNDRSRFRGPRNIVDKRLPIQKKPKKQKQDYCGNEDLYIY